MKWGLILGDQLNEDSALFEHLNPSCDALVMIEARAFSREPMSHFQRSLACLSAMRHFAQSLRLRNFTLEYLELSQGVERIEEGLGRVLDAFEQKPEGLWVVLPGDWALVQAIEAWAASVDLAVHWLEDRHFLAQSGEFKAWMQGRKAPRMEQWYRHLRKRTGYLMAGDQPEGGVWNLDAENRKSPSAHRLEHLRAPLRFAPDALTLETAEAIEAYCPGLPGAREFAWPVTRAQSLLVLKDFIAQRLPFFGDLQDAMWQDEPWLFHSLLSLPLNLRLLNPREVVEAAIAAYHQGGVPLNALEGFVRQIVGWREYVRGLYWTYRDEWPEMNALHAEADLPSFYWTGKSEMQCMAQSIGQVLAHGYGHHIQRLMVTGLFALLYGVKPQAIHHWYLGMYVDAFAWVEMPNTLGMSQFADGGRVGSKPYIASGAYIDRMSSYCKGCRYQVKQLDAPNACPFNLLYWQFIERHQDWLKSHPRLAMQVSHWQKKPSEQRAQVIEWAGAFREKVRKGDKV